MKKSFVIAGVGVVVAAAASYVAFGQASSDGMMGREASRQNMSGNDATTMRLRGMMAQSMAESMARQTVVAMPDGGVMVLAGGKLMKYDSGLNLVKEVPLKMDFEDMRQQMQGMMDTMPMMHRGMMRSSAGDGAQR
jgi:hypothetical protein